MPAALPPAPEPSADDGARCTAVHHEYSPNFAGLLDQLGISLLISTYQGGKLLAVGTHRGRLTISFHYFEQAMGVAVHPRQLAVGARQQIWFLHSAPDLAARVEPAGKHDACYLTRTAHFTGPIHCHEMAWAGDELWVVNTLFSCLCTLQDEFSFVPRWQPPFISSLAAEDRCHLNGLALEGGQPRYVTALGECDTPAGWQPTRASSGCLIDVASGATVARGFAMPHSPRLHEGRLWILDSGRGRLDQVDLNTGRAEPVAEFLGYTRGLAIHGPYAFVGLSRIRETSIFDGIPIAEQRERLQCGVAVVDLRSGRQVGHLSFCSGVEEIFAVQVLDGIRCAVLSGPLPDVDETQTIWLVPPPRGLTGPTFEPDISRQVRRPAPPTDPSDSPNDRGIALARQARWDEAAAAFREALRQNPEQAAAWSNLGNVLKAQGRWDEAQRAFEKALALGPNDFETYVNLGSLFRDRRQPARALEQFERARVMRPDHPHVWRGLAHSLRELGRFEEGEACFREWARRQPGDADPLIGLGQLFQEQGHLDMAVATLEAALRLQPDSAAAYNVLGITRHFQQQFPQALAAFGAALRRRPDWAEAHANRAITLLLTGDWAAGWPECEWRWRCPGWDTPPRLPLWDGSAPVGRRLLLVSEQGLGDTIQLIRFATLLQARGATVIARVPPPLLPLLRTCPGIDTLVPTGTEPPPCDAWIPLMSIPHRLGLSPATVAAPIPYLHADAARVAAWKERLQVWPSRRVGLVWRGSPTSPYDRYRSIPLAAFRPLAALPGVTLFSLHRQPPERDPLVPLVDLGPDLDAEGAFLDTAAVMKNLDLVISADTSPAHVAGALGVPVWVALPLVPDWRWLLGRTDSPWYPTARLFRQTRWGEWGDVVAAMEREMA